MSGSCREAHQIVRELLGGPPGSSGGQPQGPGMSLRGGRPFWMFVSCWVALPDVREALLVVRVWSGDPAECSGVVGGPPECPGVVGSLSRKFGRPSGCP